MLRKIRQWLWHRKFKQMKTEALSSESYSHEQMERVYAVGYNDGKRDGLAIAREQATNSLKEILWQQNHDNRK